MLTLWFSSLETRQEYEYSKRKCAEFIFLFPYVELLRITEEMSKMSILTQLRL